jgi:hypothetical protein
MAGSSPPRWTTPPSSSASSASAAEQVEARADELEKVARFARAVEMEMWTKNAATAGAVLLARPDDDGTAE